MAAAASQARVSRADDFIASWYRIKKRYGGAKIQEIEEITEILEKTLPRLALFLDGNELKNIKKKNAWLSDFESKPDDSFSTARSLFVSNGPSFLDTLASFMDLKRTEAFLASLLSRNFSPYSEILCLLHSEVKKAGRENNFASDRSAQQIEKNLRIWDDYSTQSVMNAENARHIPRSRIEELLKDREAYDTRVPAMDTEYWRHHFRNQALSSLLRITREGLTSGGTEDVGEDVVCTKFDEDLEYMRVECRPDHTLINELAQKIRSFVLLVGCAKVHDEPEANIAELRLFYSTTIGFFATLQDQYLQQKMENKKLRHYITALELRYLLEHLTPPQQPHTSYSHSAAGPRWMAFWEEALVEENRRHNANQTDHPLRSIVDARNPGRVDGNGMINKEYQKGQLYEHGKLLYGTLSDEIHRYRGRYFNVEDDDGWPLIVTEILQALKPKEEVDSATNEPIKGAWANVDAQTGYIDWDEERKRYLQ
ncbi:hypothetical protein EJ04DRAFT_603494 [Polyplosphaeria fusca]|uniref:Uncharacterized protein n=1 Tax=Polyplosphaeria fusca TaxID=682080 RepID=A0A9P4QXA0_9PLEO|nr:hypothetical protein EJ04DRAFT_603494 [Polyplosphaeria fusca]